MLLLLAGQDSHELPACVGKCRGRDVVTAVGRLPREARALEPPPGSGAPRSRETRDAVADERTGRRRVGCGEKRQDEDVRVPEDVPAVPGAAEAPRSERRLGAIGD